MKRKGLSTPPSKAIRRTRLTNSTAPPYTGKALELNPDCAEAKENPKNLPGEK
jgi:hypothetical protein